MEQQIQTRLRYFALIIGCLGILWLVFPDSGEPLPIPSAIQQTELRAGTVATMDSLPFDYSPGWTVGPNGADTHEPADPWQEPSGIVTFQYQGQVLALQLAVGNYWGYLYVTVDGEPANLLADIRGNHNSQQEPAGYRTFYAPEKQGADGLAVAQWIPVHKASTDGVHDVQVEIWRSWGQTPLRAVAVDALPTKPPPLWPGIALLIAAIWLLLFSWRDQLYQRLNFQRGTEPIHSSIQSTDYLTTVAALCALLLLSVGIVNGHWIFSLAGYGLLASAALWKPAVWMAAILFSLPFYYEYNLPLLPGRSFNLIEMGIFGGVAVVIGREILVRGQIINGYRRSSPTSLSPSSMLRNPTIWLWALISWALLSASAADYMGLALREWRTIFLASGMLALLLAYVLHRDHQQWLRIEVHWLLIGAWMAGSAVIAMAALWHYGSGTSLITAEGVSRVRGFYGSPNNLALYLERTVMVGAALTLFTRSWRQQLFWAALTCPQAVALLLTYSRGSLFFGLPAGLFILIVGGWLRYRQTGFRQWQSCFSLFLWVGVAAGMAIIVLSSSWGTARLQQAFDFSQGTGFLRIQMWRSAWQMALDHPLWGVGPDNFLYAFRSEYILPAAWQEPDLNHPHNWFLDFWTRLGLPGLILGLLFMTSGIVNLWQRFHRRGSALTLGLFAAACAALAHGLIDASYALPDLMMVWVLLYWIDD